MSARQLVSRAFHMLLPLTSKTDGEVQAAIIGAMGLLESAEFKTGELERFIIELATPVGSVAAKTLLKAASLEQREKDSK